MSEIRLTNKNITAVINYHGAELKSLTKDGHEYMWCADPTYWGRTSPVLFPFVGQVADGVFRYEGNEYKMGQHGFARDMDFELVENDEKSCRFVFKSNDETRAKYPLDFDLYIGYKLKDNGIEVEWEVANPYDKTLQFSIGAHPAFNCDLSKTSICIRKNGEPVTSFINSVFGKGLLTDKKAQVDVANGIMDLDVHTFDGDAFVIENDQIDQVDILDEKKERVLAVKFTSPLVGIWSPPGKNAPFLCIEPWYGRADKEGFAGELVDREWNNTLEPGKTFKVSYMIEI